MIDVKINNVSMAELGWTREFIDFPIPKAQTNTITVPGRKSPLRFIEALGRISFEPRQFSIVLTMLGTRQQYNEKLKDIVNRFNGKVARVELSEEPEYFYVGSIQMKNSYDPITGRGQLVLECEDGDSYKYHSFVTNVVKSGNGVVTLENDFMPVVPKVITTKDTELKWKIEEDEFSIHVSEGEWEIPELELGPGTNEITVKTEGVVTFEYREGCL